MTARRKAALPYKEPEPDLLAQAVVAPEPSLYEAVHASPSLFTPGPSLYS